MKKGCILLLAILMLAVGCSPAVTTDAPTGAPDVTATAATATATSGPTATATLVPDEGGESPEATDLFEPEIFETPVPEEEDDMPIITVGGNLLPEASSTFESASSVSDTAWTVKYGSVTVTIDKKGYQNTKCLKFTKDTGTSAKWHSAAIDLHPYIKTEGTYKISFRYKISGDKTKSDAPFMGVIRTDKEYSFSAPASGGQFFRSFEAASPVAVGEWGAYETYLTVEEEDIQSAGKSAKWNFCIHNIREDVTAVYFDDVSLVNVETTDLEEIPTTAKTWVAQEITLIASKNYANPLFDVEADLVLTKGSTSYTVPFFWDGGKNWRARFVCTSAGTWSFKTVCTNKSDKGLSGRTGTIQCIKYNGDLDIYKHGFVKTEANKKYFVYADGTPFFYLGDTHWGFSGEPVSMVKTVAQTRKSQGFTVIQSEPIGATFNVTNGISSADLVGFRNNDERFAIVAEYGLVHVNACFFYPSNMITLINNNGGFSQVMLGEATHSTGKIKMYDLSDSAKTMLKKLARFWVAHYTAFPVMWSLGQEVDDDFFWNRDGFNNHEQWSYYNNPYRLLAQYIEQYDPYHHPLTAHQEGVANANASKSAFRDISAHTWYASQWSQSYNTAINYSYPRDYWENGQGKPAVLYEGKYCYLWTKNFGARVQGWMAFLNGMCGYGWGGQDTWCYLSTYSENASSGDGVDTVTPEQKQAATWQDSLSYPSVYQVGYMRNFFEKTVGDWYNLVPRFGSSDYIAANTKLFMIASNKDNSKIVVYFYNFSDNTLAEKPNSSSSDAIKTGTLKNLTPGVTYHYQWFNPVTGKTTVNNTFTASSTGTWTIPTKTSGDMILYVYR